MEDKFNKILTKDLSVLLYKILNDTLFLLLIAYALLLIADSLIPGFISNIFSFTRMTLLVFANLGLVIYLGKINNVSFPVLEIKKNKLWLIVSLILFTLLIVRALYKFSVWEIVVIVISSLAILLLFCYNYTKSIREV
jgi:hypothetical protein